MRDVPARLPHVVDDVNEERTRHDKRELEVEAGVVAADLLVHLSADGGQRLAVDGNETNLRDEGAAFEVRGEPEPKVLRTPKVELELIARAANVLVRIDRLIDRDRRG